ncbi:MAG: protein-L-isoaspartate(D-aspartate) O-methyltransferase [Magnetococcales bacterium]|nr:protein-L-isoaspartate(D-aspartate) O-methyltransferase [Magnetococcales bacterium]
MVSDRARERMVREFLEARGIRNPRVLEVMRHLPRHMFVDEALAERAYSDSTLPIGCGQTLSQPYTVARMTEALELTGAEEVLEIGTGSGYQTAVLARLCRRVYTVERLPELARSARLRLQALGIHNVSYHIGDGSLGWPQPREFHRILVTAGAPAAPATLARQLAPGGAMVLPEGTRQRQELIRSRRRGPGEIREVLESCRFVPLVGAHGW